MHYAYVCTYVHVYVHIFTLIYPAWPCCRRLACRTLGIRIFDQKAESERLRFLMPLNSKGHHTLVIVSDMSYLSQKKCMLSHLATQTRAW